MILNTKGTQSLLGRCVAAEVRARIAAQRTSGKAVAAEAGMSQNYLATRLRDEKPLTLDDVERLMGVIGGGSDPDAFIAEALSRHRESVLAALEATDAVAPADADAARAAVEPVPPSAEGIESTMGPQIAYPSPHPQMQPRTGSSSHGHSS